MKLTCDNLQMKIEFLEKQEALNKKQITSLNTKIYQFEQDTLTSHNKLKESNDEKKMLHGKVSKLEDTIKNLEAQLLEAKKSTLATINNARPQTA